MGAIRRSQRTSAGNPAAARVLGLCLVVAWAGPAVAQQSEVSAPKQDALEPQTPAGQKIVFGMTPVVGVESTRLRFEPLAKHLHKALKRPVELEVTETYGELVDRVAAGKVDLVKLSPLAYVQAQQKGSSLKLLAMQVANGSIDYSSYLVALQGNAHDSQKKLKGARVCFADKDSTSGYLFPLAWLSRHAIQPERDFASVTIGGSHRACLEGLFHKRWDVAATWAGAIRDARQAGLDMGEIIFVAKTGRIPYDAWCTRPGLDPEMTARIKAVLLETNTLDQAGRRALAPTLGINGWVEVEDKVYNGVREVWRAHRPKARSKQDP